MICVVDFEGFRLQNKFLFKELAFCKVSNFETKLYSFLPPFHWKYLSSQEKKTAYYCENYLHKIKWNQGETSVEDLANLFKNLISETDVIYVKGLYKKTVVGNYLNENYDIRNLEDIECPRITELVKTEFRPVKCRISTHQHVQDHCALFKAINFSLWLKRRNAE